MTIKEQDPAIPKEGRKSKSLARRKPYVRPTIVLDLALETRAGSPLSPDLDPLDLNDPTQ